MLSNDMQSLLQHIKLPHFRHKWLITLLAFSIPVYQNILPILIVLILLNWFSLENRKGGNSNLTFVCLVVFFLIHVIGLLWSVNLDFGMFDVQVKLSFLLLPFIFYFSETLVNDDFERVLSGYVIGCAVGVFLGVTQAFYAYYSDNTGFLKLYSESLTPSLHIGYFAMYMNFAIIILIYRLYFRSESLFTYQNLLRVFLILFFSGAVFLSTSRNGLIGLLLALTLIVIYSVIRYRKWMSIISIAVIAWVIMSSLLKDYKSSALKFHGFEEVEAAVKKGKASQKVYKTSTSIRILVWSFSLNLIKSNPIIGVGTGDIKDELIKLYKKEGYPILVKRQYNSHNQYLQTAAALGIPTLIVLLLMFISPLLVRWRRLHFLAVFLSIIVGVACLTESVLEVQAGVIFYTFFASLFAQNMRSDYGTNFIDNPLIIKRKQLKE